jgi:hypothetical protein
MSSRSPCCCPGPRQDYDTCWQLAMRAPGRGEMVENAPEVVDRLIMAIIAATVMRVGHLGNNLAEQAREHKLESTRPASHLVADLSGDRAAVAAQGDQMLELSCYPPSPRRVAHHRKGVAVGPSRFGTLAGIKVEQRTAPRHHRLGVHLDDLWTCSRYHVPIGLVSLQF